MESIVDSLLPGGIPYQLKSSAMQNPQVYKNLADAFIHSADEHTTAVQCYHTSLAPQSIFNWDKAYQEDACTKEILSILSCDTPNNIPSSALCNVKAPFRSSMKVGRIRQLKNKLVYYKPILTNTKFVILIIIPKSLRKKCLTIFMLVLQEVIWANIKPYSASEQILLDINETRH